MCKENALINLEFEGRKLDYIIGEDGEPLFELYNVGMMLGYVVITKGKEYPTKKFFINSLPLSFFSPFSFKT